MDGARLEALLRHPAIWRAAAAENVPQAIPTGFRRLDERLPGGGWPPGTLIELLVPSHGMGELELLVPALRGLGAGEPGPRRWIAWLGPPYLPYAPALASAGLEPGRMLIVQPRQPRRRPAPAGATACPTLWAMEQALRARACAAALGWVDAADIRMLRRLKLAAEESGSGACTFTITAQDSADAAPINYDTPYYFSNLPQTTASVTWEAGAWEADIENYATGNLAEIINEIVAKPEWKWRNKSGSIEWRGTKSHTAFLDNGP